MFTIKNWLAVVCLILWFHLSSFSQKANTFESEFTLIELYTSQGCSSCPTADRLLSTLLAEAEETGRNIIPLSFHVDYWNNLGWKDPYSRSEFSERQRNYAAALGRKVVYTPQMIFNGTYVAVGSKEGEVRKTLKSARKTSATQLKINVRLDANGNPAGIDFSVDSFPEGAVLNVAVVERNIEDAVERGENRGKVLKHDNVVRWFKSYELTGLPSDSGHVLLELPGQVNREQASVVVFVQHSNTWEILAAAKAELK